MISSIILNDSEDTWTWSLGGNFFTVRSARCQIDGEFLPDQGHSTRWNQIIPKKVNIFVWRASRDRLPSRWNLSRRGIEVNSLNCPICDAGTETSFHTLWACSLASLMIALCRRILRYVRGTLDYGLQLHVSSTTQLIVYTDADWAGCPVTLSRSSAEVEYRGIANVVAETTWIRNLLRELHTS
ncbi:reverse transcriptase domain, reverse transcriptase zinc-binding domain protein [Tanacetum coccineum]|uniref:Reverse transcriptase domain, reverse transcriptase zinc-binding domain protein n=1 Tax=Tanacetum coccineum TaxID=301880 RepID=A0ABQ5A0R3_9ASTR